MPARMIVATNPTTGDGWSVVCDECEGGRPMAFYSRGQLSSAIMQCTAHNRSIHEPPVEPVAEPERVCSICGSTGLLWRHVFDGIQSAWKCTWHMFPGGPPNDRRHGSRTDDADRMVAVSDVERVMAKTMRARSPELALGELHGRLRALLPDDAAKRLRDLFADAIDSWYDAPKAG